MSLEFYLLLKFKLISNAVLNLFYLKKTEHIYVSAHTHFLIKWKKNTQFGDKNRNAKGSTIFALIRKLNIPRGLKESSLKKLSNA